MFLTGNIPVINTSSPFHAQNIVAYIYRYTYNCIFIRTCFHVFQMHEIARPCSDIISTYILF